MKKSEKKIAKVMREYKKGKLPIGKSKKKVKSRKQAIAIALSEAGRVKRGEKMKKNKKEMKSQTEVGYPKAEKKFQLQKLVKL